jgi:hypothetical protein
MQDNNTFCLMCSNVIAEKHFFVPCVIVFLIMIVACYLEYYNTLMGKEASGTLIST